MTAIRIFVGCAPGGLDAESLAVLDFTLRKHSSQPLDIKWMHQTRGSGFWGGWRCHAKTPFSQLRWTIPEVCGFAGKAIYMDSDMVCLADISELFDQPMGDKAILLRGTEGKLRTCVMLMDCERLRPVLPSVSEMKRLPDAPKDMVQIFRDHREVLGKFDGQWNCIDLKGKVLLSDPSVKMLHYSRIPSQPHMAMARRRLATQRRRHWFTGELEPHRRPEVTELFMQTFDEAQAAGFRVANYDQGRA